MDYELILFDLDGTLGIPSVGRKIVELVISDYSKHLSNLSGKPYDIVLKAVIGSLESLRVDVPGTKIISEVFMERISERASISYEDLKNYTLDYYITSFNKFEKYYTQAPGAREVIEELINNGYKVGIATDPVVLQIGNYFRLKWISLEDLDYCIITSAENSYYVKPDTRYYEDTIRQCRSQPEKTIMIGNDVKFDIEPIEKLGGKGLYINFNWGEEVDSNITQIKELKEIFNHL
mgnify:CR=1 FL=1